MYQRFDCPNLIVLKMEAMKTKWISSNNNSHCYLILAVIVAFICTGCSLDPSYGVADEQAINEEMLTEYFYVHTAGTTISAFDGKVLLDFPAGTIATSTRFSIVSFPLDHLDIDGINLMQRGFSIRNITNDNKFEIPVKVIMRYDLADYNECEPCEESDLIVCRFYGDKYAFHKVEAIGECCMNCSCKTVNVCINECGTYVVVEN